MTHPRVVQTVLDTDDARGLAEFYRCLLGYGYPAGQQPPPGGEPEHPASDWLNLRGPGDRPDLAFQQVEDYRPPVWDDAGRPQQLHLDAVVGSRAELERQTARVVELGGQLRHDRADDADEPLRIFTDPAGHPFCIFVWSGAQ